MSQHQCRACDCTAYDENEYCIDCAVGVAHADKLVFNLLNKHLDYYADLAGQGDYWAGRHDAIQDFKRSMEGEKVLATHPDEVE